MQIEKTILDMCCGSRMFWFDRADPRAVFVDIRAESHILCDGRKLEIAPDLVADFRQLPFADNTFQIVVFDPPHLTHCGPEGWQGKKYGILSKSWKDDLTKGFAEAFRVLRAGGVLIFKWNELHIPTRNIIKLSPVPPIFGHPSGKRANTNWVCFQKPGEDLIAQLEAEQKSNAFLKEQLAQLANFNPDWDKLEASQDSWRELAELQKETLHRAEKAEAELSAANEKLNKVITDDWNEIGPTYPAHYTPVIVAMNGVTQHITYQIEEGDNGDYWQPVSNEGADSAPMTQFQHWKPLPAGFTVEGE
ncbi:class I SAM-dependent methyltransferase [Yersinia enterocolitica]|uniref:class I SAM-dependent methyltransferase n=1 Tax=Yersinia enterocolitica TaxID=630 RepID=UPI00398D4FA2